jgi:hypothetical protein
VDFWDLTKLLFQRWYITVPMVVATGFVTAWTSTTVKPDYIATAYVQLIPPTSPTTANSTNGTRARAEPRNPWLDLGLGTLCNAAIVTVQDQKVIEELDRTGLSGNFTIAMSQQTPLVTIEITGESGAQATATAKILVERFDESVKALQDAYGAPAQDHITTRRLDLGTNIEESNSKVKRAIVAVLGAGILMTVATTVGIDAMLRRRARRRPAAKAERDERAASAGGPPGPPGGTKASPVAQPVAERDEPPPVRAAESEADLTMAIPRAANRGPSAGANTSIGAPNGLRVEYRELGAAGSGSDQDNQDAPTEQYPMPSDATIVLPMGLPKEHWGPRDGEGKKRR